MIIGLFVNTGIILLIEALESGKSFLPTTFYSAFSYCWLIQKLHLQPPFIPFLMQVAASTEDGDAVRKWSRSEC